MEKHYFLGTMTHRGFYGFFNQIIEMYTLKKLYILKGGNGIGKSTFMKKFAAAFEGEKIDFIHCASDPDSLDGVVLIDRAIGIIDGTAPHMVDPIYPGIVDKIVNLGDCIIESKVKASREIIDTINTRKKVHLEEGVKHMAEVRKAHIELEELYKGAVDFEHVSKTLKEIVTEVENKN